MPKRYPLTLLSYPIRYQSNKNPTKENTQYKETKRKEMQKGELFINAQYKGDCDGAGLTRVTSSGISLIMRITIMMNVTWLRREI